MTRPCVHFVGFRDQMRWNAAYLVWGPPDFAHYVWDQRARREIADGDTVVFAKYEWDRPSRYNHDDSNERDDPAHQERLDLLKETRE